MGPDATGQPSPPAGLAVGCAISDEALSGSDKSRLHAVADGLHRGDPACLGFAVRFMELETRGMWHGRARAMFARRLKHCVVGEQDRERVARAVRGRLASEWGWKGGGASLRDADPRALGNRGLKRHGYPCWVAPRHPRNG
jgi:hypothetical protein